MDEILRNLRPGSRVLDLGAYNGSFPLESCPQSLVVRVDLNAPAGHHPGFVRADAAALPFRDRSFDGIVSNHSLEHIAKLAEATAEIGRVVRPNGSLFVAVPDASTFSDRLYRWIFPDAGGHVNPFRSASALSDELSRATGLKLVAKRDLYSSFDYLKRFDYGQRGTWRLRRLANRSNQTIMLLSYAARLFDRIFQTRASAYGWAFYFGTVAEPVETQSWSNVCVGCGAGMPAAWLSHCKLVRRRFLILKSYNCPVCDCLNLFTAD